MRAVVQRTIRSSVTSEGTETGRIGEGLTVLLGVGRDDDEKDVVYTADKILNLRIFEDENGKTNLSLADVNGELLLISQFTLYANCKRGNRPSFIESGDPALAEELYEYIISKCKENVPVVEKGSFGADMKVSLINDGPFTIVLDSDCM